MSRFTYFLYAIILLLTSCKTLTIDNQKQNNTKQQVFLGSIGEDKDFILQNSFNSTAIPSYKAPIKLSALQIPFTKQTHKTYTKAKTSQPANVKIIYIDSLETKPKYIQLKIADQVVLVEALNKTENKTVKNYLSHNTIADIITTISIAYNAKNLELITQAEAVFLVETNLKTYALELHKEGKRTQIPFNQGIVFAYKAKKCCWQENKRKQLHIVDLVSEFNDCPFKTYRSSKRAKQKVNYYKL